ncbi:hypothetical protein ABD91_17705 [Lysinibacillus sphaericus]|uniref:hypothetical protein n=1 Tax=Lysinibacillus sphaericus TaxID=1421 RepID=UPI0018CEC627|nr:hypothetical protein [Lysinibacillus sphaericus]MBG9692625.1 hypothetical protein [Lysinibacillus sphaericus]
MELVLENQRLTSIEPKYHNLEIQEYYNSTEKKSIKSRRSIVIKLIEIGVCKFKDRFMIEDLVSRIEGQKGRSGKKRGYENVQFCYDSVFEAAFAYLVENHDFFYARSIYAFNDGMEKYELHRRGANYEASSVIYLLSSVHRDVHKPYYSVNGHNEAKGYIVWDSYRNKQEIAKEYGLSKEQLEIAIANGEFEYDGIILSIKYISSSIEPSLLKWLEKERELLKREKNQLSNPNISIDKKINTERSINDTLALIEEYERLILEDEKHNDRVVALKGKCPIQLWNEKACSLKEAYVKTAITD